MRSTEVGPKRVRKGPKKHAARAEVSRRSERGGNKKPAVVEKASDVKHVEFDERE